MEKVKVIGLTSFSSIGISFFPGMEANVEKIQADEWIKAGLVKKANEDIEDAQLVEEPKVLTPEEIERIVSSCFGPNEELLLHLNGADYCGFLRIPNYSAINYAFNKRIDTNGILEISDGLVTKLLSLDYYQDVDGHWVADVEICH